MTRLQRKILVRLERGEPMFATPGNPEGMFWRKAAVRALLADGLIVNRGPNTYITTKGRSVIARSDVLIKRSRRIASLYYSHGSAVAAEAYGVSIRTAQYHAHKIGENCAPSWSAEEDALIREHYPTKGGDYVRRLMARRSTVAVRARAIVLGVRRLRAKVGTGTRWLQIETQNAGATP